MDAISPWLIRLAAFMWGAVWGSFFNVAIYRWPRGMSVVSPPSHCPHCGKPVSPIRNFPILGYIVLRGRAACCGARLTPRYLLVELVAALITVAIAERWVIPAASGPFLREALIEGLIYFGFAGGLLVATFVDLEWMEIPDEVSLTGAAFGLITVSLRSAPGAESAALGAGLGFLTIQVLFVWTYERVTGRRGMGEGDAKLLLMIGAFIGWQGAIFALVGGALQGMVAAGVLLLMGRSLTPSNVRQQNDDSTEQTSTEGSAVVPDERQEDRTPLKIPFGPFLSLAALEFLFFGETIVETYATWISG
jgi:leader peptidase (prepilin peptidase) / N-methyltransferase